MFVISVYQSLFGTSIAEAFTSRSNQLTYIYIQCYNMHLVSVTLSGECDGNIEDYVSIENVYMKDHFSSDAAGLVGVPVRVSFHDVKDPELAFVYDPDKLHGMPEKNFVLLRANEKQQRYETVRLDRPDDNTYTVTASIREEGVYTLVDAYEWYAVFNQDVSEFEYERE